MRRFKLSISSFIPSLLLGLVLCAIQVLSSALQAKEVEQLDSQQTLTIATWGGSYENAQRAALFEPFEKATGVQIKTTPYGGGLDILNNDSIPDIIDMTLDDAVLACDRQLILKMDTESIVRTDIAEFNAKKDFVENSLLPCGIAHISYST